MNSLENWTTAKSRTAKVAALYIGGLSSKEIATTCNLTAHSVRWILNYYMPTPEEVNIFKRKYAAKKLKQKGKL
jgi:transposase